MTIKKSHKRLTIRAKKYYANWYNVLVLTKMKLSSCLGGNDSILYLNWWEIKKYQIWWLIKGIVIMNKKKERNKIHIRISPKNCYLNQYIMSNSGSNLT